MKIMLFNEGMSCNDHQTLSVSSVTMTRIEASVVETQCLPTRKRNAENTIV